MELLTNITDTLISAIESIMSHEEKRIFPVSKDKEMLKAKQIHALNKIISRVNNNSDSEILKGYVGHIEIMEKIIEVKSTPKEELDLILVKYSIDLKNANELKQFLIMFYTIGLQNIEKKNI